MKLVRAAVAAFAAAIPLASLGAGALDPSFGTAGRASFDLTGAQDQGEAGSGIAIQADGKILAASQNTATPARILVTRHNTNGTLDTTFGTNGVATLGFGACGSCAVTGPSLALLANGSIIVAASAATSTPGGLPLSDIAVTRLTTTGAVDTSFGASGVTRVNPEGHSIVYHLAIQGDGGILIAGSTAPFVSRDPRWLLTRVLSNGAYDPNYPDQGPQPDLGRPSVAQRVGVQSTGHIVVFGKSATGLRGYRFHPQSTEPAIAMVTGMRGDFSDLRVDAADRVWLLSAGNQGSDLLRLLPDFSGPGYGAGLRDVHYASVAPLPGGDAFLAGGRGIVGPQGNSLGAAGTILKLDTQGNVDTTFGDSGRISIDHALVNRIARQSNGRIVGVGVEDASSATSGTKLALVRVDPAAASFVSTEWLNFPIQSLGTRSGVQTVKVTNVSSSSRTITLTPPANFEASGCSGSLAAGASCFVLVDHRPTATTAAFSSLDFAHGTLRIADSGGRTASVELYAGTEKSLVQHYYRSILRRDADSGGWQFWNAEALRTRTDVDALSGASGTNTAEAWYAMAMTFLAGPEYSALGRADDAFITDLYRTFFDRAPDADGLNFWRGQLASGLTREAILTAFMFSTEFANFNATYFSGAANRPEIDLVMDMYRGLLGRLPDTDGLRFWVQRLQAAQCRDAASVRAEADGISSQFAQSLEYANRGRGSAQYVADLYNAFLRRAGDASGFGFWKSGIDNGSVTREAARRSFLESPEFAARVQRVIAAGCK